MRLKNAMEEEEAMAGGEEERGGGGGGGGGGIERPNGHIGTEQGPQGGKKHEIAANNV
jgi:hypothetical protein